jgi:Uma2 family endonuclease
MSDAMAIDNFDENRSYTYADYLTWEGKERYQLINGKVFQMASPPVVHQAILVELSTQFYNWLRDKPGQVFFAPLDVRLFPVAVLPGLEIALEELWERVSVS